MSTTPTPQLPEPPPPPSGSSPKFVQAVRKNPMFWCVIIGTGFIMYSGFKINSATAQANTNQFGHVIPASGAGHGAQLSSGAEANERAELEAAIKAEQARNEDLQRKVQALASAGNPTTTVGQQQPGAQTLTPAQHMAQQILADRQQAQYKSLWATPILAVQANRALPSDLNDTAERERRASEQGLTGTFGDGSKGQIPSSTTTPSVIETDPNKEKFSYDDSVGPYHIIPRGTVIGGTLQNDLNSQTGGSLVVQLDAADRVYVAGTKTVAFPEGTQLLGTAGTITTVTGDQNLLGMTVDQIQCPDKYSIAIPPVAGMSQTGMTGVPGHVNTHFLSKFGWTILEASIVGATQVGNETYGYGYDPSVAYRQGFTSSLGLEMQQQLMQHVFTRPNTVIIPRGTRIKAMLKADLPGVPEWQNHRIKPGTI